MDIYIFYYKYIFVLFACLTLMPKFVFHPSQILSILNVDLWNFEIEWIFPLHQNCLSSFSHELNSMVVRVPSSVEFSNISAAASEHTVLQVIIWIEAFPPMRVQPYYLHTVHNESQAAWLPTLQHCIHLSCKFLNFVTGILYSLYIHFSRSRDN